MTSGGGAIYNGHTYSFYVTPGNNWGGGPASNTAAVTVRLDAPQASASPGKAKVTVTWGAIAWADYYNVSRSEDGGQYGQIGSYLTVTSLVDTGVRNGHTYAYKVGAINTAGGSDEPSPVYATVKLDPPSGLSLVRDATGKVTFSWGAVADADSYSVGRSPDTITGQNLGTTTGTFMVDDLPWSPVTYYQVLAHNAAGDSPVSYWISTEEIGCNPSKCAVCTMKGAPLDGPGGGIAGASAGPSNGDPVNLATGREYYQPAPDITVYNPSGPAVVWQRQYSGVQALKGYGSPGLSPGWVHTYDTFITATPGSWGGINLNSNSGGVDYLVPSLDGAGQPTGAFTGSPGSPYFVRGVPGTNAGEWQSITVTFRDQTQWRFTSLSAGTYALTGVTNRTSQSINLLWSAARALTQVSDASSGAILLSLAYGADGRLSSVTDSFNRQIVYAYEAPYGSNPGRLKSVSQVVTAGTANPPARWSFTYDTANGQQLKTITVPSPTGTGNSTATINYDGRGRVTSLVDANNNKRAYTYNSTNTLVQVKDPAGSVVMSWTQKFNADKVDTGVTDANSKSTVLEYGDVQNPTSVTRFTDKNGKVTSYAYDQYGNVRTVTTPRNVTTTYTYDYTAFALGRLTSIQEGTKPATTFTYYEPSGLVQSATSPSPAGSGTVTTSYTYDALGNVLTVAGPGNNAAAQITATYNYMADGSYTQTTKAGQPLTITDSLGHATHLRYDAQGRITSATDAIGNETDVSYNLAGQLDTVTLPATGQTGTGHGRRANSYSYPGGPLTATTLFDESGAQVRQITYGYGAEGERLSVAGSTEPVTYTYDALYRLKTLKDGNNNTTTYSYNSVGYVSNVQMPGGENIQFPSYDFAGHLLQRVDGNGATTNYLYNDAENKLTDIQYPATPSLSVHLGYDAYGRRNSMTDGTGSGSYVYGNADELQSATTNYTGLPAQAISYSYYPNGSRQAMTTPAGTFSYTYDAAGQPSSMTNPFGETSAWSYFENNRPHTQTLGNGSQATYTYNAVGQLIDLTNTTSGGATLSQFSSLLYDGAGNRMQLSTSVPAFPTLSGGTNYQYDSKNQLKQEQTTRGGGFADTFAYDSAGNPTSFKGVTKVYNSNDQQTDTGFSYDSSGNPTAYNGNALTFDPENRMTGFGGVLTSGYRGDGVRAWKQTSAGRTYFIYDGTAPVVELDATGAVVATNTFGATGLISRRAGGSSTFYTFDPQGGVAQRLDASQAILSSHQFAAHGAEVTAASSDPFGYGARWGYYTDRETSLQLLTNRYYDPGTGRFLTRDPISYRGGINLYGYTANRPVRNIDPSGLDIWGFSGGASAAGGLGDLSLGGVASAGYVFSTNPQDACGCGKLAGSPMASAGGVFFPDPYAGGSSGEGREGIIGGMAGIGGGIVWAPDIDNIQDLAGEADSLLISVGPFSLQIDDTGKGSVFTFSAGKSIGGGFMHFKSHTYMPPCPTPPKYPLTPNGPVPVPLPTPTPTP